MQRQPAEAAETTRAPEAEPALSRARVGREWNPIQWAEKIAPIVRKTGYDGIIVTIASNTAYAFDTDGGSLREIAVRIDGNAGGSSTWRLDVAHGYWREPMALLLGDTGPMPLSKDSVKSLCEAMGYTYGGPASFWVMLRVEPDLVFTRPKASKGAQAPSGDTPAMRLKAKHAVEDLSSAWRDRPKGERSALVGLPTFSERYSKRTGWQVRITLDQEITEIPLKPGDSDRQVRERVDSAVKRLH